MSGPNIDTVRDYIAKYSNWGRWGVGDQLGTLNFVTDEIRRRAAGLARTGRTISMALPYDDKGPQTGGFNRFNPIHLMTRDGADEGAGTMVRDFYGGNFRHFGAADDLVILPLQCGTQWDSLAHVFFEGKMYNGYPASEVSSKGARKNAITNAVTAPVGRGVLLDLPQAKGVEWLEPGYAITGDDLDEAAAREGVTVQTGDFVQVRTGAMARVRAEGSWGGYAAGAAPGLGLAAVPWVHERQVASVATDTWGMEVLPNETPDVFQPLHILLLVHQGLLIGEIWDLEDIAADCAADCGGIAAVCWQKF
jgi:kynurenine formamidase